MDKISENFIDLEKVIRNKNPRLLRIIPGFIISYLKRIIHQEEVNQAIYRNRDKFGLDFCNAILDEFKAVINVEGLENINPSGRYIIASNHPLGGLDGMALMSVCGRVMQDIKFPVNDFLMYLPGLRPLFIPINKHGSNIENINIIENTFASDATILYFPAGLCSRKQKGNIMDLQWKITFISKAIKHKRDIVPCYIEGRNSNFFYNLANLRKKLGIKANIEMLYLVDEMYKQKNKTINITFGKPVSFSYFDKSYNYESWAQKFKSYVYALGSNRNITFDEFINTN
jgi:putative hemolysin